FSGKTSSCLVNPRAAFETKIPMIQAATSRSIAVVGAGPAGLYAAFTAKQRGHDVTLYDASARIGGQLNIAAQIPGKEEFKGFLDWLEATRTQLGIDTRLGTRATAEDLAHHDAVIVATGVTPRRPDIDGIDHPKVVSYLDVLRRNVEVGRKVAVIGAGGIGFDTAQFLVHPVDHSTDLDHWLEFWGIANPKDHRGGIDPAGPMPSSPAREVTLLQRSGRKVGAGLGKTTGWIHRKELQMMGVRMMGGVNYHRIDDEGLHISLGEEVRDAQVLCVDHVVICAGQLSYDPLSDALSQMGIETHVIGGAFEAGELDAKRAIDQAVRLAVTL
ncbi:MAG: FAD-dependent oxidoreductase, partial [Paracoccaceae bacterium]